MGRHIPRLAFLSIALSDEDALTPAQDCYQRLLRSGDHDEMEMVDQFLRSQGTEVNITITSLILVLFMHSKLSDLWILRYGQKPYRFAAAMALNCHARYSAGQFG